MLASNPNPKAILLMEPTPDEINWIGLSSNPNGIPLLKSNQDMINWRVLSSNPGIFEIDISQYNINIVEKANIINLYIY